jgi:outer membrane immunogenic protein
MKKFLVAGIAAAAFCGVPVLAADLPTKAPVYKAAHEPMFNWTGCYIGGNVGGAWSGVKSSYTVGIVTIDHTFDGWVGGGQFGCDYQFNNNWVIGIQGMFDGSGIRGNAASQLHPEDNISVRATSFGTVTGELGYLINPTLKFYGKAGIGWVTDKSTFNCNPGDCTPARTSTVSSTRSGFDAGFGLAWMYQPDWNFFVEYDHMWLGTKTVTYDFGGPFQQKVRQDFDKVLVGINYRFGK